MTPAITYHKQFTTLVQQHKGIVYGLCHANFSIAEDVEDHAQECLLQAWHSYPNFRNEAKFSTWLYSVALNTIRNAIRSRNERLMVYVNDFFDYHHLPAEDTDYIKDAQLLQLTQAIRTLSKEDQELIGHYLEERPYKYIAQATGKNENTCRMQMNRIKQKLKKVFIK